MTQISPRFPQSLRTNSLDMNAASRGVGNKLSSSVILNLIFNAALRSAVPGNKLQEYEHALDKVAALKDKPVGDAADIRTLQEAYRLRDSIAESCKTAITGALDSDTDNNRDVLNGGVFLSDKEIVKAMDKPGAIQNDIRNAGYSAKEVAFILKGGQFGVQNLVDQQLRSNEKLKVADQLWARWVPVDPRS